MKPSFNCITLIKKWEGYSATAYPDPATGAEPWTIGWGSTRNMDTGASINQGDTIDEATATRWLELEVDECAHVLEVALRDVPLNQNQWDALVSLAYNVGPSFGSGLLSALKSRDWQLVADKILLYNKANGREMEGLTNRRREERALFLKLMAPLAQVSWFEIRLLPEMKAGIIAKLLNSDVDYESAEFAIDHAPIDAFIAEQHKPKGFWDSLVYIFCALFKIKQMPKAYAINITPTEILVDFGDVSKGFALPAGVAEFKAKYPTAKTTIVAAAGKPWPGIVVPNAQPAPKENTLLLTRTGRKDGIGCEELQLKFLPSGESLLVRSGLPSKQIFRKSSDPQCLAGSCEPIPQNPKDSFYYVHDIEWAGGKDNYDTVFSYGLGPAKVYLEEQFEMNRGEFLFHYDGGNDGTLGCVATRDVEGLKELISLLRKYEPRKLTVDWGL